MNAVNRGAGANASWKIDLSRFFLRRVTGWHLASQGSKIPLIRVPESSVLAKKTVKNQLTLPKKIADAFPGIEYFRISVEGERIVLEPVRPGRASEVRERLEEMGISGRDVAKAVAWARRHKRKS